MLRRVLVAPRHYLEHSVAVLTSKLLTRNIPSVRLRWSTIAATSPQYSAVRHTSWYEDEDPVEVVTKKLDSSPSSHSLVTSNSTPPEELANIFIQFLGHHGQTTRSALHYLNSGLAASSPINQILCKPNNIRRVAKLLAACNKPASCVRLLSLAVAYGCPLNASTYEGICWTLSRHQRYSILLEVYRLAKENLGSPTCRLLDWRLRALFELENYAALRSILQDYEDANVKPSRRTWHLILVAHLRNRNLAAARQCLSSMEQAGFPPNSVTHSVIAANYQYLGLDPQVRDLAISVLGSLPPSKGVFVVNRLLESHFRFNDELAFHQLLSLFDSDLIGPIRALLSPLGDLGSSKISLPDLKLSISLIPDADTFLIAIRFCMAHSDFLGAENLFVLMERQGISLSPAILAAYLDLQFSVGRPGVAVSVASQLVSASNLEDLYDELSQHDDSHDSQSRGRSPFSTSQIAPHVDVFNALLRGLLKIHGLDVARIVFELMQRVDVEPNSHSLKILIDHLIYLERATPSTVLRVLRQLFPVFRPSPRYFYSLISRILRDEKRRLYSSRLRNAGAFNAHANLLGARDQSLSGPTAGLQPERVLARPNLARSLIQSLDSREIRSDSLMLALRIRYDGVLRCDTDSAVDTYTNMLSRGIAPSIYHISALMEGFAQRGETDTALKIMRSAKEYNMKPNLVMYTILLNGYAHQNQPKAGAELFQAMVSTGIQPDVRAIYALCNAFILARQLDSARKLLITLWPYIEPLPRDHHGLSLLELLRRFYRLDASLATSRRNLSLNKRILLQRQLTRVVLAYKRASGLQDDLISNTPEVRRLAKKSLHVSRKI